MSLNQALATAVSGLKATQTDLSIVSANVANAQTPGYIRRTPEQVEVAAGQTGVSVRVDAINRQLDQYVQKQLRVESSGASYADLRAQFYSRLQNVYGTPGSDAGFATIFDNFTTALQGLSTSPDSPSARSSVISSAQVLAQQLNSMTTQIQGLRGDAEAGLAQSVTTANDAMSRIAQINQQLANASPNDAATANLFDQRDKYVGQLAKLMDINVIPGDHNQISVFTNSGLQLVGVQASQLSFDQRGTLDATETWNADPTKRGVGTISLVAPNGSSIDLLANSTFRSGQIAAYVEMRDQILVQAQGQLDEIAAKMSQALSDVNTSGTAVTVGAQTGFDIDLAGLLAPGHAGNSIQVTYTDNATNTPHTVTFVRVDDPKALPLPATATANPNDKVVGLDVSGGMASIVSQISAALAATPLQVSNPAGTTLRVLDDGALNQVDVNALSSTVTATSLTSGAAQLPFFLDANSPYTGAITGFGSESVGLAGRIAVNPALVADPSRTVVYQTAPLTSAGDATRPNYIYSQLTGGSFTFAPQAGVGTTSAPFSGTLTSYLRQVVSQQSDAAQAADGLKQGQDVVLNSLQARFDQTAGVKIDEEMANLVTLQNTYGANARVLTTINAMFDMLMKM
jgi:flagellar hook-associated protein 1 FlgK